MPEAEPTPATKPPSRFKRYGTNMVRVVLIALIIWTSYWAAKTVKRIMAGPQNPVAIPQEVAAPPSFQAVTESPAPGFWAFEKQDWAVSQSKIAPTNFEQHVLDRLKTPAESTINDQNLLTSFRRLGGPTAIGEDGQLYRIGTNGGPFALSRGHGAAEQLVAFGFIMPEANGDWRLLEMLPTPNAVRQQDVSTESLLPLPPKAKRLMSRWSNSGKLILDWVHVPISGSEMVQQWKTSGLQLHKTAGILGAESSYLYEQNGEVIIVNTFPSTEGGADLLITTSPDVQPLSKTSMTERKP